MYYVSIHMYIYTYVFVYTYIHIYIYTNICTCIYIHTYVYTYVCMYIHTWTGPSCPTATGSKPMMLPSTCSSSRNSLQHTQHKWINHITHTNESQHNTPCRQLRPQLSATYATHMDELDHTYEGVITQYPLLAAPVATLCNIHNTYGRITHTNES